MQSSKGRDSFHKEARDCKICGFQLRVMYHHFQIEYLRFHFLAWRCYSNMLDLLTFSPLPLASTSLPVTRRASD